jgi:predicted RNase H-like nuclease
MATIGGTDGCPGGWVCVERDTITGDIFAEVFASTRDLMERGRYLEVDAILRSDPELRSRVREIHPEVCFYAWAGHPMQYAKRTPEGRAERLRLVEEHFGGGFEATRRDIPQSQAADDDILDAFAALWTAERIVRGMATTLPAAPLEDRFGLRMEMVA